MSVVQSFHLLRAVEGLRCNLSRALKFLNNIKSGAGPCQLKWTEDSGQIHRWLVLILLKKLVTFKSICTIIWIFKKFYSISDHANLLKRISICFIAGGLLFEGSIDYPSKITVYSALASGRKPLKIRPRPGLGGISFEISSFEEGHDLRLKKCIYF